MPLSREDAARIRAIMPQSQGVPSRDTLVAYAASAAEKAGIDPQIFVRQIQQESGFRLGLTSPAGARGVAQIVPKWHPNARPDDPYAALDYAANLMANHLKNYGGDYRKALAAYNAGPGAIAQYGGVPPFKETQTYLRNILGEQDEAMPPQGQVPPAGVPPVTQPVPAPTITPWTSQVMGREEPPPPGHIPIGGPGTWEGTTPREPEALGGPPAPTVPIKNKTLLEIVTAARVDLKVLKSSDDFADARNALMAAQQEIFDWYAEQADPGFPDTKAEFDAALKLVGDRYTRLNEQERDIRTDERYARADAREAAKETTMSAYQRAALEAQAFEALGVVRHPVTGQLVASRAASQAEAKFYADVLGTAVDPNTGEMVITREEDQRRWTRLETELQKQREYDRAIGWATGPEGGEPVRTLAGLTEDRQVKDRADQIRAEYAAMLAKNATTLSGARAGASEAIRLAGPRLVDRSNPNAYLRGYEPGGQMSQIHSMARIPFAPLTVGEGSIPFNPYAGIAELEAALRAAEEEHPEAVRRRNPLMTP